MPEAKTKLIDGESFTISQPYTAGHVVTEAEAKALNQVRSENIGNNLRSAVKAAKEKRDAGDSSEFDGLAAVVAEYDTSYSFAMGGGGTPTRKMDPIEREARSIANDLIKADLQAKGRKLSTVPEGLTKEEWEEKLEGVRETLSTREDVLKLAKKRVAERQKLSEGEGLSL